VTQVERPAHAAIVRVLQADSSLIGGAAANELAVRKLPQRRAGEQAGLDDFGHAVEALVRRKRLEQRRIDDRPVRPMEGADEVLCLRQVDSGLASDGRVDLAHQ
jgi:hypothetical protein